MANVSSSNGLEKRPTLSFRDANGAEFPNWQRISLGTIIEPYSEKVHGNHDYEVLTSSREGLQRQTEHFGSKQRHDTDGYNIVPLGFCTYRNRSDDGRFAFNINKISDKAIVSKFYPVFRFVNANSTFMTEYLNSSARARKKLSVLAVGTSQVVLSFEALKSAKFDLPCKEEQDKIAALLECINTRIAQQHAYVNALKKYKRGLSDELFVESGTAEDWMTVPFDKAFELLQNNTFSRNEMSTENGIVYNIHYGDVLIKYGSMVNLSKSKVPYIRSNVSLSKFAQHSYLRDGDIVIADTAEDYTVGKAVEIVGATGMKALSGLHTIPCRPKLSFAPMYLGYFFNSKRFRTQMLPLVQGTKVSSISKSEILKTAVVFPSYNVQSRIASMLYTLDQKIDICNACAHELVRVKETLLQQLFI